MLFIQIDRKTSEPIYRQIVQQIQTLIDNGTLSTGSKLPPSRVFAAKIGVNRSTVYRAYEELWALGYVEGRPGSYLTVRERIPIAHELDDSTGGLVDWQNLTSAYLEDVVSEFSQYRPEGVKITKRECIDFSRLQIDPRLLPVERFRKSMNRTLYRDGEHILNYFPYAGYQPLREYIAQRMRIHGVAASMDNVLITNGSQHALDLITRVFAGPGKTVAVEAPTYANMLPLLRCNGVNIVEVPMLSDGADLEVLETVLQSQDISFFYTMPNFQNPTGITTDQAHRERLLEISMKYRVPIVEDGFEEEMKYFGKVALPVKSMDTDQIVIYVGTFSKVLMAGVRIGWIVAEKPCTDRLLAVKRFADIASNSLSQAAVYDFCIEGLYDLHIRKLHRVFRRRMQALQKAVSEYINPIYLECTRPAGGYLAWGSLPGEYIETGRIRNIFENYGVIVSYGNYYFARRPPNSGFRLSISMLDEDTIYEGVRRLGDAVTELQEKRHVT